MIHRAMFGSMERFTGILLENTAGHLPLWLAPVQAMVCTIVSDADAYAEEVLALLRKAGLRAEIDLRNEKINYKVREHSLTKTPVMLVVGKREAEERKVSVRRLGSQEQQVMPLTEAIAALADEALPPDLQAQAKRAAARLPDIAERAFLRVRAARSGANRSRRSETFSVVMNVYHSDAAIFLQHDAGPASHRRVAICASLAFVAQRVRCRDNFSYELVMRIAKVALAFFSIGFLAGSFERAAGLGHANGASRRSRAPCRSAKSMPPLRAAPGRHGLVCIIRRRPARGTVRAAP